ncbi:hypothetical protein Pla108_16920 [Botrimarina colliarenosi]|uniref:PEP-CTERM protein-sorting domain-containing protein n=1 Tax=Botrimarina colliarenosi TaxID=2528001 RepID=A0A5C6ADM5_9BACT|nr:hypothetical protein [Botrimarina colliarenosi]TWT97540.1 hypothetical protein Pla108_16920 [Botrimarina colliarenosi]
MHKKRWRHAACNLGLLVTSIGVTASPCHAAGSRSGWMWSQPANNYGSANIIGDPQREEDVLARIDAWGFDRAYVSYGTLPLSNAEAVANWNKSLANDGVTTQLLLGENTWIYPQNRTALLAIVQSRLVNFNLTREDPRERIHGVHLDIEPHGLSAWSAGTPADRKEMLYLLSDTYAVVRQHLDSQNASDIPIFADLPVWYDSSTSIGWDDAAERDSWFAGIAESLEGISMMAFERKTLSSIVSGVDWEIQNLPIEVRVGLNAAEIGPGKTFADFAAFDAMATSIEQHYGDAIGGVDYQPFYTYVDAAPALSLSADFDSDGDVDGADFLSWQKGYGLVDAATPSNGDANGNGSVNRHDLSVWESQFVSATAPLASVPEPSTFAIFVVALLGSGRTLLKTRTGDASA